MTDRIEELAARIRELQDAIEEDLDKKRAALQYRLERGRVVFQQEARRRHRAAREKLGAFLRRTRPLVVLTAPVIYSLIIPFVLLDIFVTLYQAICFPVYGIPRVRRADYIAIDRHLLDYLNPLQKLNCVYCGYCNGLIAWVREIASRTEAYWCPIKHARRLADAHPRYARFADFGDETAIPAEFERQRAALRQQGD